MGNVLFVVAPMKFRDEELFETREVVEKKGHRAFVASTMMDGPASGALGGETKVDLLIDSARPDDFDAIVIVGGIGVEESMLDENDGLMNLVRMASAKGKIVAAICIAPRVLAAAELVNGKNVTCFDDEATRKMLEEAGGKYTGKPVEVDGLIITANGPKAAREFGESICRVMSYGGRKKGSFADELN